ncbi:hypothetical protein ACOSP7_022554 [Xanthoceras sorbifolium]
MSSQGRSLPKFGEWDVNNPASAEGFSVIFEKASDEKRAGGSSRHHNGKGNVSSSQRRYDSSKRIFDKNDKNNYSVKRLLCCAFIVPKK